MEYAATVTVNPLTALRMLEDFVQLNPGTAWFSTLLYQNFRCPATFYLVICIPFAILFSNHLFGNG